jgi:hypothetical protein
MKHTAMVVRRPTRIRRSPEEIAAVLQEYRSSGLTQVAFVRSKGLCLSTLTYWLRRSRHEAPGLEVDRQRLVPVRIAERHELGVLRGGFEVTFPGGLRLTLPSEFDEGSLRRLLPLLSETC